MAGLVLLTVFAMTGDWLDHRVHFITRSGVFKHPLVRKILRSVNMIPIYRKSDGKGQLSNNDASFEEVRKILQRGEHVLIFVEGFCKHQTTLQTPLKKGAPRMLLQAWEDGLDVRFLPVWLRYNSFVDFPKEIDINYGTTFGKEVLNGKMETGAAMVAINKKAETVQEVYDKVIAEKFMFEKRLIVNELKKYGIYSVLTQPENLTLDTINKYLEIKARGIL